jgi:hypothetical protein
MALQAGTIRRALIFWNSNPARRHALAHRMSLRNRGEPWERSRKRWMNSAGSRLSARLRRRSGASWPRCQRFPRRCLGVSPISCGSFTADCGNHRRPEYAPCRTPLCSNLSDSPSRCPHCGEPMKLVRTISSCGPGHRNGIINTVSRPRFYLVPPPIGGVRSRRLRSSSWAATIRRDSWHRA